MSSTQARQFSPDPEYVSTETHLRARLRAAAQSPDEAALVFLDEFGYYRWAEPSPVWTPDAPAEVVETERAGRNK